MSSSGLVRWVGIAALVGGVPFVLGGILGLTLGDDLAEVSATGTFFVRQSLFLFGTVSMPFGPCTSQSEAAGTLGVVGFLLGFLGTALLAALRGLRLWSCRSWPQKSPALLETGPFGSVLSFVTFAVGRLSFEVATLRAGVYPGAAAIALIVGAMLPFVGFILSASAFAFGIAVAWSGFVLFTGRSAPAGRPSRVG